MTKICLVSCSSKKLASAAKAADLYVSPLFRKAREFAEQHSDCWYILSAKHGLLNTEAHISPYDLTLNALSSRERSVWAESVFVRLKGLLLPGDEITILAGSNYREFLEPKLRTIGTKVKTPLQGMSIGRQIQWLDYHIESGRRASHLRRFYDLLETGRAALGGRRLLSNCSAANSWPTKGVYFFFEPQECRRLNQDIPRVVRVGTHGVSRYSQSTLWTRLRAHRGNSDGRGNHRSSIFRLHVGAAIMAISEGRLIFPSWGVGQVATAELRGAEEPLERLVSEYIGRMSLLWLRIEDEAGPASDRAFIERNAIGLLAGPWGPYDPASPTWLGNFSKNPAIRTSALWNVDHVNFRYDPRFLDVLEEFIDVTLGNRAVPQSSIAPKGWHQGVERRSAAQLKLFEGS